MKKKNDNFALVIKVGNEYRPASTEDISNVVKQVKKAVKMRDKTGRMDLPIIITHHAIEFEYVKLPVGEKGEIRVVG